MTTTLHDRAAHAQFTTLILSLGKYDGCLQFSYGTLAGWRHASGDWYIYRLATPTSAATLFDA